MLNKSIDEPIELGKWMKKIAFPIGIEHYTVHSNMKCSLPFPYFKTFWYKMNFQINLDYKIVFAEDQGPIEG